MLNTLKDLVTSKKFLMLLAAWAGLTPAYVETHNTYILYALIGLHAVWMIAQGIADHGKSAAALGIASAAKDAEAATKAAQP